MRFMDSKLFEYTCVVRGKESFKGLSKSCEFVVYTYLCLQ